MLVTRVHNIKLVTAHSKTPCRGGSDVVAFVGYHGGMCAAHHDSPDVAMEMMRRVKRFNLTGNLTIVRANKSKLSQGVPCVSLT